MACEHPAVEELAKELLDLGHVSSTSEWPRPLLADLRELGRRWLAIAASGGGNACACLRQRRLGPLRAIGAVLVTALHPLAVLAAPSDVRSNVATCAWRPCERLDDMSQLRDTRRHTAQPWARANNTAAALHEERCLGPLHEVAACVFERFRRDGRAPMQLAFSVSGHAPT